MSSPRAGRLIGGVAWRATWLCGALLGAACSSSSPTSSPSAKPDPATTAPAPRAVIEVKELTIRFQGMPIARLHADGRTESVGDTRPQDGTFSPGPRLHGDGTIELTEAGFKARVEDDGDIFIVGPADAGQPDQLFGRISGDKLLTGRGDGTGVRLESSQLVMFHESKVTNVIGAIEPPTMGRTALIMTAAFFIELAITAR